MNKIKLVILACNKNDNSQINSIIKNLEFKKIFITILYSNKNQIFNKSFLHKIFFKIIFFIEHRFLNYKFGVYNKNIKTIKKKNQSINEYFDNSKKKINIDVILDLGHHVIRDNLLKNIKYGLWYLDYNVKDNFYIGFKDCLFKKKITKSFLFKKSYLKNKISTICLDKSNLNNKINFWLRNKQFILNKSSNLVSKNLNRIFYGLKFENYKYSVNSNNFEIRLYDLFSYILQKYLFNFINRLNFFGKNSFSLWSLHVAKFEKNFIKNSKRFIVNSIRIKPPTNFEWADPFIFSYKKKDYVFFENNDLKLNKGKISFGEISQNKLIKIKDILNLNFHLSYPFIWEYEGNVYLIPETSENKSIHIWKAKKFPDKWVYFKTLLENEYCCDTTILQDKSKNNWLLTNKSNDNSNDPNNELYIYKIIGHFKKLIPHKLNPVITDCLTARNAGQLKIGNQLLRPSQINDSSGYGIGLNINKIISLSLTSYKEKIVTKIIPNNIKNVDGLHHINNSKKHIIFDVRYKNLE